MVEAVRFPVARTVVADTRVPLLMVDRATVPPPRMALSTIEPEMRIEDTGTRVPPLTTDRATRPPPPTALRVTDPEVPIVAPPTDPVARIVPPAREPVPLTAPLETEPPSPIEEAETRDTVRTPDTATRPVPIAALPVVLSTAAEVDPIAPTAEPTDFAAALLPAPIIEAAEVTGAVKVLAASKRVHPV